MAVEYGKDKKPGEKVNALKTIMPYTTGGTKYPKPTMKIKPKKNGLGITWKF
jgi:hypothetical protein